MHSQIDHCHQVCLMYNCRCSPLQLQINVNTIQRKVAKAQYTYILHLPEQFLTAYWKILKLFYQIAHHNTLQLDQNPHPHSTVSDADQWWSVWLYTKIHNVEYKFKLDVYIQNSQSLSTRHISASLGSILRPSIVTADDIRNVKHWLVVSTELSDIIGMDTHWRSASSVIVTLPALGV